jgi:hypothetical protein
MTIFLLFLVSVGPRLTNAQPGFAVDFKASSSFLPVMRPFPPAATQLDSSKTTWE